jgi:hypothetical protein
MAVIETSTHPPLRHARAVTRRGLPGPMRAQVRVPSAETAVYLTLVPLAFLPLLLATVAAVPTLAALAATTGAVATLLAVQRIVVGDDYVAVRRLHGYRVVPAAAITAIRARPSQRGGTMRIDVVNARPLRLRHVEAAHPAVNTALHRLANVHAVPITADATRLATPRRSVPAHVD